MARCIEKKFNFVAKVTLSYPVYYPHGPIAATNGELLAELTGTVNFYSDDIPCVQQVSDHTVFTNTFNLSD